MAVLHKEFIGYNKELKLTEARTKSLRKSRKKLRKKIRKWFEDNKPKELQPKFNGQGSFKMNVVTNPIPVYDSEGNTLLKYDLDDGIYFIEKEGEDNRRAIDTWHDWVFQAVEDHTNQTPIKKNTCVRVVFADGHHIDLPIYYKKDGVIELAHKSEGWVKSDPKEFFKWFNEKKNAQLERSIRFGKGWKNYKEIKNSSLKLPSGFELTILFTKHYVSDDNDDTSFRETVRGLNTELNKPNGFKCIRPTTPKGEDLFENYSDARKNNFLASLTSLLDDLDKAKGEKNFKKASEILRSNQFGERFPVGEDKDEEQKTKELGSAIGTAIITPKPYGN